MDNEKVIKTTGDELRMLIGLAADKYCEANDVSMKESVIVMHIAAEISHYVQSHFNGENIFSDKDIEIYCSVENLLANVIHRKEAM